MDRPWYGEAPGYNPAEPSERGFDLHGETARLMVCLRRANVRLSRVNVYDLAPGLLREPAEVVYAGGLLYHLRHPLLGLQALASVTGGVLVVETAHLHGEAAPLCRYFRGAELNRDETNFFACSPSAWAAMHWRAGFAHVFEVNLSYTHMSRGFYASVRHSNCIPEAFRQPAGPGFSKVSVEEYHRLLRSLERPLSCPLGQTQQKSRQHSFPTPLRRVARSTDLAGILEPSALRGRRFLSAGAGVGPCRWAEQAGASATCVVADSAWSPTEEASASFRVLSMSSLLDLLGSAGELGEFDVVHAAGVDGLEHPLLGLEALGSFAPLMLLELQLLEGAPPQDAYCSLQALERGAPEEPLWRCSFAMWAGALEDLGFDRARFSTRGSDGRGVLLAVQAEHHDPQRQAP